MKKEMKQLLKEIYELLDKHDASVVRSGDDNHKLVLSICNEVTCQEEEFEEDIDKASIKNHWHRTI
jgi:hypothetical protein